MSIQPTQSLVSGTLENEERYTICDKREERQKTLEKERDQNIKKMRILFISIVAVVIYRIILDILYTFDPNGDSLQLIVLQRYILNLILILTLCFSIRDTVKTMKK